MNKIAIVTDSTCDLPETILKENNIYVVGLLVNFSNGDTYIDGKELQTEQLYELVERHNELPKTSAAPINEFLSIFEECIEKGYDVIYTGIGASFSRSFHNAVLAKDAVGADNIYLVDSENLSTGIGLQVLEMIKLRNEGLSGKEIFDKICEMRSKVRAQFAIETMNYLHKGGRCSSVAKIFGTVLKIKPIIKVREGKMSVGGKPRGKMKVALEFLLNQIETDKDDVKTDNIIVTHSLANESANYIITRLNEIFPGVNILETNAGCVISSHCGKGTIGILYVLK